MVTHPGHGQTASPCLIVRDEAVVLPTGLENPRQVVDEIIIVNATPTSRAQ
ncbi:MAG: hypothetical protein GXP41_09715 [Chloroflexi bacterium]|nr:hypothetical protein [Chloroflexota bacterium]